MKIIEALKKYKKIVIVDQMDLEKEYGITWEEANDFIELTMLKGKLVSDQATEEGFEEAVWECEVAGYKIRNNTLFGIGSVTSLELI